jgi:hypothetical protein
LKNETPADTKPLLGVVLKTKYKSCAHCYLYDMFPREMCIAGYPLKELEESHSVKARFNHDTFDIKHRPKYGCLGKQKSGNLHIPLTEHIKVAKMLSEHYA